jgi:MarR family transcriptional regulator, transcriptional regulator for hemolysin
MESRKPLGYMLGQSLRVFKSQMVSEFKKKEIELSFEQFVILHMLNSNCDLIQRDIATQLQKDKSIIVRQINGLLEKQYIVRLINKNDKRIKNLILTKKGFETLNQVKAIADEISEKLLTGIPEADLEIFRSVLLKIQENGGVEEDIFNCGLNQQK